MSAGTMDLYRALLDSLGAVVWERDPDARRFVGLDTILQKPFTTDGLLCKVREVIDR